MNILDIAIAKKLAGGGGGSGTDNYNDLSNLPKINDTTLSGNKSSSALGLQSEINSDSKLASDLVDDTNQDNKFVTSTEKNTWNAKQNAIDSDHKLSSDLVDDANKTNKFVTSTEKNTWNAKQNAIDSDHKLSSSLVSFSTAEAAALASGIDSTKVGQISTNQTNILYSLQTGVKNLFNPEASGNWQYGLSSYSADAKTGTISIATTASDWARTSAPITLPAGEYKFCGNVTALVGSAVITGNTSSSGQGTAIFNNIELSTTGTFEISFTLNTETPFWIAVYANFSSSIVSNSVTITGMMICTKAAWDQEPNVFRPFAAPNYDLTYREQQDRNALVEVVDKGAKNLFNIFTSSEHVDPMITRTINSNGTVTVSNDGTNTGVAVLTYKVSLVANTQYIISGCPSGGSDSSYSLSIRTTNSQPIPYAVDYGSGSEVFTVSSTGEYLVYLRVAANYAFSNKVFSPMVCTKAAFGVSNKFVPFGNDPFYQIPINHNMVYRGRNLGATLTDAQHTALSSGNFTDLYLGDYWTKTVTIPAGTYIGGDSEEVTIPEQTSITLKAVIADFDTFYGGYDSSYAIINAHHAAIIVTGFSYVVWNKTNSTAGGYVASLIHKWLVGSALPQIETWFGSAKVLSHQKLLTNAITGDAASGWAWSSQKISLLSENQMYGSKVWGGSKATNGGYEPGEAFKHLNVFNHIDASLLFGNKNIWLRDIASAERVARLIRNGHADSDVVSDTWIAPAALILLS